MQIIFKSRLLHLFLLLVFVSRATSSYELKIKIGKQNSSKVYVLLDYMLLSGTAKNPNHSPRSSLKGEIKVYIFVVFRFNV